MGACRRAAAVQGAGRRAGGGQPARAPKLLQSQVLRRFTRCPALWHRAPNISVLGCNATTTWLQQNRVTPLCALAQVELMPGVMMPMVGYGTAGLTDLTADAVFTAIRVGYRLVDSAGVSSWA